MKILHYVDENRLAWGEAWLQLLEELERRGVRNHVVCKPGGTLSARLARSGAARDTFSPPVSWLPVLSVGLGRLIDKIRPDIIHTRLSSAARTGGYWGRRKKIPVVQSVDKYPKAHYHKNADLLLPCSVSIKEHMAALGFAEDKMQVVLNPLKISEYRPDPELRARTRAELGIKEGWLLITGAGRFVAWKGFDDLLAAYAAFLSSVPSARTGTKLLLAGDGEERRGLLKLAGGLGIEQNLITPGFVSDIRPYLQASDIFVLPSRTPEPFGIVLLEAMASGAACIATRGGGALDMITEGVNGWFADLGSVPSLSAALVRAAGSAEERKRLAAGAVKRAEQFDVFVIAGQIISIYREILENR